MTDQNKLNQLRWRCRRGMLELDQMLIPFFDKQFSGLTPAEQQMFTHLLAQEDPSIFAWLMGHEKPNDKEIQHIVRLIKQNFSL